MYFLLKMWIFHCYVSLPEGRFSKCFETPWITLAKKIIPAILQDLASSFPSYLNMPHMPSVVLHMPSVMALPSNPHQNGAPHPKYGLMKWSLAIVVP